MPLSLLMIAAWNVRGMNASENQRDVANFVHSNRIGILGLVENKLLHFHRKMFSTFDSIDTCDAHPRCRVWLL